MESFMNFYSITYDLVRVKDYAKLKKGIIQLCNNVWVRPTESQWIIATNRTSAQVRDYLLAYIDSDDLLFVARIYEHDLAWFNIPSEASQWIKSL